MISCDKKTLPALQSRVNQCLQVLKKYDTLTDAFMLDFFVDSHWTKLPPSWRRALSTSSPEDMSKLLDLGEPGPGVGGKVLWPLEILALRACVKTLTLPRKPVTKEALAAQLKVGLDNPDQVQAWAEDIMANGHHKDLKHIFRKHIKPKKQHEIARMKDIAAMLSAKTDSNVNKVDVGSGVGHLSRLLAFGHDFRVICVDAQEDFSQTALKFDRDLLKSLKDDQLEKRPQHLTLQVDHNLKADEFEDKVEAVFQDEFGLVGLHTCGDLGPTMIRLFAECKRVISIQSVGCCYMHLKHDFPLSQSLKSVLSQDFTYTQRELACHAIENYVDRLKSQDETEKLKVHSRRALLEWIIQNKGRSDLRHACLKAVKRSHELDFRDYVRKATQNLDGLTITDEDLEAAEVDSKLSDWWSVVSFYSLRLLLAPLIETVLLLDRCLYLQEQGFDSVICPIFNPRLSPRNFAILSHK